MSDSSGVVGSSSGGSSDSLTASDYDVFRDALQHFSSEQTTQNSALQQSQHTLDLHFATFDSQLKRCTQQWTEYTRLQAMQHDLYAGMSKEQRRRLKAQMLDDDIVMELAKQQLDQWRQCKPNNQRSWFLQLVLGKVTMQLWKKTDRSTQRVSLYVLSSSYQLDFKDAYNRFKRDTTLIFVLFPLVQLFLPPNRVLFQLHQLWLLYYYFTLSLRENILYANGSSMKSWWLYHHYVSIALTFLLLLWPDDFISHRYHRLMLFGVIQGAVMLCQYLYQSKRSYVRKTLGKANSIDVDATETIVEKPTDLKWLVPLLYALYCYEWYIGCDVLYGWWMGHRGQRWVPSWGEGEEAGWGGGQLHLVWIGLGFQILAIGNAITTTFVLVGKQQMRKWTKMIRSRERSRQIAAQQTLQQQQAAPEKGKDGGASAAAGLVDGKEEAKEQVEKVRQRSTNSKAEVSEEGGAASETKKASRKKR